MTRARANSLLRHIRRLVEAPSADFVSDRALLERFTAGGDQSAFAVLVRRHGPMVQRVCRHILRNSHDAEDAFQATFLVLARRAAVLTWQESVAAWLHAVASRLALKARTTRRRRAHEALAAEPASEAAVDPVLLAEAQVVLNEELNRLPEKLRIPLVLRYLEGMSQDEAAQHAGWSVSTFKRRLREGLEVLRERLRRRGVGLIAALSVTLLGGREFTVAAGLAEAVAGAALLFRRGLAAGGKASPAALLAEALLRSMYWARLRSVGILLLAAMLALGGGLAAFQAQAPDAAQAEQTALPTPMPPKEPPPARPEGRLPRADGGRVGAGVLPLRGRPLGLAFSPDGTRLAGCSGLPDGAVHLWQAATRRELWRRALGCGTRGVAFAGDGRLLAAAGDDGTVRLLDPDTGKELRRLHGHEGPVGAVVFTPDHKSVVSAGTDGTVRLWDRTTGKEARRFAAPGCAFCCLSLTRDGSLLAAGSDDPKGHLRRHVFLWELPSGRARPPLAYYPGGTQALAFAPNDRTLAVVGVAGNLCLWDMKDANTRLREINAAQAWQRLPSPMTAVAFSADGRAIMVGGFDGAVYVCDRDSGKLRRRLAGLGRAADGRAPLGVLSLALAPDGQTVAAGGDDWVVHLWEIVAGQRSAVARPPLLPPAHAAGRGKGE
jgi:RNA polymerase sigma factor (sigma-70 family)